MHGLALFAALFAAVIGTTSAEFNGVGCFKNSESDPVLKAKWSNELMTPEACENYCISSEMPLYGLQGGDACWCGDCYVLEDGSSKYDRHGSASCGIPCTGEPSSDCGGDNAFSLFYSDDCIATQAPVPTPSPTKLAPTTAPTESLEVTMSPTSAEGTL